MCFEEASVILSKRCGGAAVHVRQFVYRQPSGKRGEVLISCAPFAITIDYTERQGSPVFLLLCRSKSLRLRIPTCSVIRLLYKLSTALGGIGTCARTILGQRQYAALSIPATHILRHATV